MLNNAVDEERGEVRQANLAHEREVLGEHDGAFDDLDLIAVDLGGIVRCGDHVAAGGAGLGVDSHGLDEDVVEVDVVRHFDFRQIVLGDVVFKRLADGLRVVHGLPHADEICGGRVEGDVAAGREDKAVGADLVHQLNGGLLVVLLRAE